MNGTSPRGQVPATLLQYQNFGLVKLLEDRSVRQTVLQNQDVERAKLLKYQCVKRANLSKYQGVVWQDLPKI